VVKRKALAGPTRWVEGRGIHGGQPARLRVLPAARGAGLRFRRADLAGCPSLGGDDIVEEASEGGRTSLRRDAFLIQTVEHAAAAVWGLGLDDALVEVDGPEPPACDGSALPFVEVIREAGVVETSEERPVFRPASPLAVRDGGAALLCLPSAGGLRISYHLDYPGEPLAQGRLELNLDPDSFARELAPCRTFCPAAQVDHFLAMGWGKGADTENTLILEGNSVRDNRMRFADEPVRHKMLDVVGDLAFLGGELVADLRASRSGHRLNRSMLESIRRLCRNGNGGRAVLDVNEIRSLLPHRYPFLLVDRVLELEPGKRAVGMKNLTFNEPFFQGHFPRVPVMPGVLQVEAMAQLGGILLNRSMKDHMVGKIAVLASIEKTKLRKAVVPGDQLVMEVHLDRFRGSFGQCSGKATVDGNPVSETVVRFAIVPAGELSANNG
jgi:UDP-3-O-[3-hydroxymyristoyl] N-acetylglucosamine deacetylase/3-hydroxyacyl-[acyl-carrier-protein] dehydratase